MNYINKINNQLNKYPKVKRVIKRIYQVISYSLSKKEKYKGNIQRITPKDDYEYFFGYYDKSPWDVSDRYLLCLQVRCTYKEVAPKESANIILIDTKNNNKIKKIACTNSWNVQQGCMLQWLGPDYSSKIIYNDFRNGKFCSVIKDVNTLEERVIDSPVYSVSSDGSFALTLDFARLHRLRPGYGYSNLEDTYKNEKIPADYCIWKVDLTNNIIYPLLKYIDFYNLDHRKEMNGAEHKVNHIMLSPNNERFMLLHRWYQGERKYSRLVTVNVDGTDMYNLSDDDMVSHCFWKNNESIIAFENKKNEGPGYYLMKDNTGEYKHLWEYINNDGHPSYSPNKKYILIDSYPDGKRMSTIKIMSEEKEIRTLAKVFSPFKYDNDLRCDLHPRWNRKGDSICFDSVFEGARGLYMTSEVICDEGNSECNHSNL